jgi:hypothetical protein
MPLQVLTAGAGSYAARGAGPKRLTSTGRHTLRGGSVIEVRQHVRVLRDGRDDGCCHVT